MQTLSVAIVACNEAENIRRTISSVKWANEINVVDSGSTDKTVEIAKSFGARIFYESWKGYGAQVNSALNKCTSDWILNLDADEWLTPELADEIQSLLRGQPKYNAYMIPRLNRIFGRWMRHGGLYPDYKLRLFRRGVAHLREDTEPHATPKTEEPSGKLKNHMLHLQYRSVEYYIEHMQRYSTATIPLFLREGRTSDSVFAFVTNTVLNPALTFIKNYIFRGGFLDGREGLIFHLNHSAYVNWKFAKAWEAHRLTIMSSAQPVAADDPAGDSGAR
ncbi:MAG TPA: glycosyltransferase family 2 protein [Candidatus Sulfotelmatobacter sp.]|jgi:glycosyltransferase involved in cell wall biosynthesis